MLLWLTTGISLNLWRSHQKMVDFHRYECHHHEVGRDLIVLYHLWLVVLQCILLLTLHSTGGSLHLRLTWARRLIDKLTIIRQLLPFFPHKCLDSLIRRLLINHLVACHLTCQPDLLLSQWKDPVQLSLPALCDPSKQGACCLADIHMCKDLRLL